jgi:hypothetical protein
MAEVIGENRVYGNLKASCAVPMANVLVKRCLRQGPNVS